MRNPQGSLEGGGGFLTEQLEAPKESREESTKKSRAGLNEGVLNGISVEIPEEIHQRSTGEIPEGIPENKYLNSNCWQYPVGIPKKLLKMFWRNF